jgi:hypothetical protein
MSTNLLRKVIKECLLKNSLNEADALKRKLGKEIDFSKEIEPYVEKRSKNEMCEYAITMTELNKVGINPRSPYETPRGIYFYPLNTQIYSDFLEDYLPFASDAANVSLVKLKNPESWLNVGSFEQFTNRDVSRFAQIFSLSISERQIMTMAEELGRIFDDETDYLVDRKRALLEYSEFSGNHWENNNACKIFDLSYFASRQPDRGDGGKANSSGAWSSLLSKNGFLGIYDEGLSVIHENEPHQLVAFSTKSFELVKSFDTSSVRKSAKDLELTYGGVSSVDKGLLNIAGSKFLSKTQANKIWEEKKDRQSKGQNQWILQALASNVRTPVDILEKLSASDNINIRIGLALNPKIPSYLLDELLKDENHSVRVHAATNTQYLERYKKA